MCCRRAFYSRFLSLLQHFPSTPGMTGLSYLQCKVWFVTEQNCLFDFWNATVKVYHHFHACHVVCLGFKPNTFLKRAMIKKDRCLDQCPVLERTLCVHYQFQSCFMLIEVLNDPKHIQHLLLTLCYMDFGMQIASAGYWKARHILLTGPSPLQEWLKKPECLQQFISESWKTLICKY